MGRTGLGRGARFMDAVNKKSRLYQAIHVVRQRAVEARHGKRFRLRGVGRARKGPTLYTWRGIEVMANPDSDLAPLMVVQPVKALGLKAGMQDAEPKLSAGP